MHWSGVASSVIVIGRAPASSSAPGATADMARCTTLSPGSRRPQAVGDWVTAPPGAPADAAVAQGGTGRPRHQTARTGRNGAGCLRHVHGSDPERARQGRRQGSRSSRGSRDDRDADRRPLRRPARPHPAAALGRACSSRSRLCCWSIRSWRSCDRSPTRSPSDYRPGPPIQRRAPAMRRTSRSYRRTGGSTAPSAARSRCRPCSSTRSRPTSSSTERCASWRSARGLDLRESARMLGDVNVATADTMLAFATGQVPRQLLASHRTRDPAGRHRSPTRTRSRTRPGCRSSSATIPSTRPVYAGFTALRRNRCVSTSGRKKVKLVITSPAPGAGPTRTFNTLDEARQGRRERPRLGRSSLPLDDDIDGQGLPADRPRRRQALLPAARRRRRGHPRRR